MISVCLPYLSVASSGLLTSILLFVVSLLFPSFSFFPFLGLRCLLYLGVARSQLLQHLLIMLANFYPVLIPICCSQFFPQQYITHHGRSHFFLMLHAPKDYADEIEIVVGKGLQISKVLTVFKAVLKGYDSCAVIVFNWLAQVLTFDQTLDFSFK